LYIFSPNWVKTVSVQSIGTYVHSKMLGCFNPNIGQIWTNPNVGLKNAIKKITVDGENYTFNPTIGLKT